VPIHHTLKAWQHAQRLAVECVKAASRFPDFEQTALADQLRRACYSFLDTAWGSLAEVQTALVIARDVGYIQLPEFARLEALATETSKTLFGLLRKISQVSDRPKPR